MSKIYGGKAKKICNKDLSETKTLLKFLGIGSAEHMTLCWMTSNSMNNALFTQNTISGNERRWNVGILFQRNGQNYAD